jgi:tRNA (adenine22-N1)-methyltransferase
VQVSLSPRLATVAEYVLPGEVLVDIGTDHAYLPTALVQASKISRAIAGDLLPGPLEAARATVDAAGLTDQIELRLGNGLGVLQPGEAACASICGMGGPLIVEILTAGPLDGLRRLVLQPMGSEERIREWLVANYWRIIGERLITDSGRIYVIIAAERGEMALSAEDALLGPILRKEGGPLFSSYVSILLEQARRALAGAIRSDREEARRRMQELQNRITLYEEAISLARIDDRTGR